MRRTRLLLAEPRNARRLELIAVLRADYDVLLLTPTEDTLRVVRRDQPAVVVLGCHSAQPLAAARTCRALKTEQSPPIVGVLNGPGVRLDAEEVMQHYLADGYLCGPVDIPAVADWVAALVAGEKPVRTTSRPSRFWRQIRR